MLGETWRHSGVYLELSRLTNLCLYASMFVNIWTVLLSPRQASALKPDVETACQSNQRSHTTQSKRRATFSGQGRHVRWNLVSQPSSEKPAFKSISQVRASMYFATWCRKGVQKWPMQFTITCSMTSVRHVLFPEHSRKSRPALFPPISLILIKSSRRTRKLISAQNRFNQSSCVKDRRLVRLYVLLCHRESIMHRHLSSLVRLNSKTCRFTLSTWPGSEPHQAWCDAILI